MIKYRRADLVWIKTEAAFLRNASIWTLNRKRRIANCKSLYILLGIGQDSCISIIQN